MGLITKLFGTRSEREIKKLKPTLDKILALEEPYKKLSEEEQTLLDEIVYSHFSRMDEEENCFSWQHDD